MLEFDHVSFKYDTDDLNIIDDLSFSVGEGEFVSLIGASGFGKSTIFRLINKLLTPLSGEIRVGGRSVDELRIYCGYMPQHDLLFPWRTVAENLRIPLEIRGGFGRAEMAERVNDALEAVGLGGLGDRSPTELSGGMRQRAAFARTLLTGCELLLLDEPFSALDYLTRLSMREWLLRQWERERKTVLFITHDVEEAVFLSGRVLAAEASPIRSLDSINVPLEYPRTIASLKQPAAADMKEQLIGKLRAETGYVKEASL